MSAFRALRHRDYRLYFSGQIVSWVGTWMQSVALAWMVHRLTGQPKWLGIVTFVSQVPMFLLSPFGGVLADRVRSRRLTVLTQTLLLVQALGMTALAWHGRPALWMVLLLASFLGILNAFDFSARSVLVALTVPREDLPNAVALNSSLFHGSRILGPALAGLVLAAAGEAWCFGINAFSYLAALGTLVVMRAGTQAPAASGKAVGAHLAEGVRYALGHRKLRMLFLFVGVFVMLGMPYTALMPVFADTILGAGPRGMGWLMGAGGIGATLGALVLARHQEPERLPRLLAWSGAGMAVCLTAFAHARSLPLAMGLLGLTSLQLVITNTGCNTLVSLIVPQELRGRVLSLYAMVFTGAMPLGALVAGYAAQRLGAPWVLTAGALGCLATAAAFGRAYPRGPDPSP